MFGRGGVRIEDAPTDMAGLGVLVVFTATFPAVLLVVGFEHNASPLIFNCSWAVVVGALLWFWILRLLAVLGRRPIAHGLGEKVAQWIFQVAWLLAFVTSLLR